MQNHVVWIQKCHPRNEPLASSALLRITGQGLGYFPSLAVHLQGINVLCFPQMHSTFYLGKLRKQISHQDFSFSMAMAALHTINPPPNYYTQCLTPHYLFFAHKGEVGKEKLLVMLCKLQER
jgi:hypothetical protein